MWWNIFKQELMEENSSIIYYLNLYTCSQGAGLWNSCTSHWPRAITGRWKPPSTSECLYFPAKCCDNPKTTLQSEPQVHTDRNKSHRTQGRTHRIWTKNPRRSWQNRCYPPYHVLLFAYFTSSTSLLLFWHHHLSTFL